MKDDQVAEGRTIEFKESLPGNADSDKKEFLADVSSFANSVGGHIVYGVREKRGIPVGIPGVKIADPDADKLRLENMLRHSLEPRVPGVSFQLVSLGGATSAFVIRVPHSWAGPHRVTYKGHGHFYSRNSAGKYPLDVPELRAAFALSETAAERVRDFRAGRLAAVGAADTPVPMREGGKIVLHLAPLSVGTSMPVDIAGAAHLETELQPLYSGSWSSTHNFDGFLTYSNYPESSEAHSYTQLFRSGAVEAVESGMLADREDERYIPSELYEQSLIEALSRYLGLQKELGVGTPILVMLSLIDIAGYSLGVNVPYPIRRTHPIERNSLIMPEVMAESFDINPAEHMRTQFDMVWNSAGYPRSLNYNDDGDWVGQHRQ